MIWHGMQALIGVVEDMVSTENMREDLGISNEDISVRAYELWEQRGHEHGQDVNDWLTAEAQLIEAAIERDVVEEDIDVDNVLDILESLPKEKD